MKCLDKISSNYHISTKQFKEEKKKIVIIKKDTKIISISA